MSFILRTLLWRINGDDDDGQVTSVDTLQHRILDGLRVRQLELAGLRIRDISVSAFEAIYSDLEVLHLQDNRVLYWHTANINVWCNGLYLLNTFGKRVSLKQMMIVIIKYMHSISDEITSSQIYHLTGLRLIKSAVPGRI